jgi:ribosomal protein S5
MAGPQRERRGPRDSDQAKSEFQERVIQVNRCAKVVKGRPAVLVQRDRGAR